MRKVFKPGDTVLHAQMPEFKFEVVEVDPKAKRILCRETVNAYETFLNPERLIRIPKSEGEEE